MKDLISVVIPAYNAEKFIGGCLEKLLKQDYENIEVVVVNDGSKDATLDIASEFAKKDKRVRVLSQENSGSSVARINGLNHSNGKYVLFLDSDDFFADGAITRLLEIAQKYDTDLIKFRYQTYPELVAQPLIIKNCHDEVVIRKDEFKDKVYPLFIKSYALNANGTLMLKREKFKIKDVNSYYKLRFAEDMKLSIELFDIAQSVTIIPDILYNYFTNYSSTTKSSNIDKILYNLNDFITVYSSLYDNIIKWNMDDAITIKEIDLKILREIANFYSKILSTDDKAYLEENKEKITSLIYSELVNNAIKNIKEEELDKNYLYYDFLIKIYRRERLL